MENFNSEFFEISTLAAQLEKIYTVHFDFVYGLANSYLPNNADDVTAEFFGKKIRKILKDGKYEACKSQSFIYTVASNYFKSAYRLNKSKTKEPLDGNHSYSISTGNPYRLIDLNIDLQNAMACLSEKERMVISKQLEGFNDTEISKIMEISEDVIRVVRFRAKKKLKNYLSG